MDKDKLTSHIQDIELKQEIKKIIGIYETSDRTHSVKSTKFLTPNQVRLSKGILGQFTDTKIESFSINPEAERKIMYFYPEYYSFDDVEINLSIVKIASKSKSTNLTHRDYLGSILSLGIERENIGDIVFDENKQAYVIILKPLDQFLLDNLSKVKHESVNVEIVNELPKLSPLYEDMTINVASMRIDSVIARLLNLSRDKAQSLIQAGKVYVDYVESKDKSMLLEEDTVISVRGYGKFRFDKVLFETKKNRLSIRVLRYLN